MRRSLCGVSTIMGAFLLFFPIYTYAVDENVVFICASSTTEPEGTVITPPEKGFFGKLFSIFSAPEPTYVYIDCPDGVPPEPLPPPTDTSESEEGGIISFLRKLVSPPSAPLPSDAYDATNQTPSYSSASGKTVSLSSLQRNVRSAEYTADYIESEIDELERTKNLSPYSDYVSVTFTQPTSNDPNNEIFKISVSRAAPDDIRVPLSTFSLANSSGESYKIPGATAVPFPGLSNEKTDVVLKAGDVAYIITGSSPNGLSFRLNTCTGYFNQGARFRPRLPSQCPYIAREKWAYEFQDECYDFIETIGPCQTPSTYPLNLPPRCQERIAEKTTYNACFYDHKNDATFYKNEWRIYLSRRETIFSLHYDSMSLLDTNGKIVWHYEYR